MRLNRYLASSGKCSRRHADEYVFTGRVAVNGVRVDTPAIQVREGDRVTLDDEWVVPLEKKSYWIMNKPCEVVTTLSDPQGRLTVRDLLRKKVSSCDHLKPVGRLDYNTSGILLFTNDGTLHHTLTHPSKMIVKEYQVELTATLPIKVLKKLRNGIRLLDGFIRPDFVDYLGQERNILIIRLHSGKNRIIRRLIEKVGGEIKALHRLSFAGIDGRKLEEGDIRELTEQELKKLHSCK